MTCQNCTFVFFLFLMVAFTQVASWTIDLPEVRKFLFEKNEKHKNYGHNEYGDYLSGDQKFFNNIEGNSKHNSEEYLYEHVYYDKENYANEYGYQSYMEKKVHNIVSDGSKYLDGLQRSLEDYNAFLQNCNNQRENTQNTSSTNTTAWRPEYDPPRNSSMPSINSTDSSEPMRNIDNSTVPRSEDFSETRPPSGRGRMTCTEATKASEQVRRFADLALWATKRLQDLAYAKKYEKTDEQEENELILKLAWFLDRLAFLSGYEPENKESEPTGSTSTTTAPEFQTLVPSSREMVQEIMDCLRRNSSEPATVRCQYPMQIPDLTAKIFNISGPSSESSKDTPTDNIAVQSSEILIAADNSPNIPTTKSQITKRSTEYTYYFPPKPHHELTYPAPVLKLIKHRLSNIKSVVKSIVERRLAHIAEKKEDKELFEKHFDKRSIDEKNAALSNSIDQLSSPKLTVKSIEKKPFHDIGSTIGLIYYPVSDVSIINTKSFRKRSIDQHRMPFNHLDRMSNLKSSVKYVKKGLLGKKFEHLRTSRTMVSRLTKHLDSGVKSIKKRYTDDPMTKLANYYIKFKVWDTSNPKTKKNSNKKAGIFEIKNDLNEPRSLSKRSLFNKQVIHMHVPKPLQIVRTYVNGHRQHHPNHKPILLAHLQKLHDLKHKKVDKIHKKIKKRSLHYGHKYLPRIPMDPQGDISYYIKNKEGTDYNPSLVQAAQVRLGLEQIFQNGNIEVVRRFGSNYNPLNPAPFISGVLASMADT